MKTYHSRLIFFLLIGLFTSCQSIQIKSRHKQYNDFKFLEKEITQLKQDYSNGTYTIKEVVQLTLTGLKKLIKMGQSLTPS